MAVSSEFGAQQTMQRIVQRYIFDIQREAEVTEDDFEEIKQDISSFRYDLINQMTTKSTVEDELKTNMAAILQQLQSLKEEVGLKTDEEVPTHVDKKAGKFFDKKSDTINGKFKSDVCTPNHANYGAQTTVIQEDPIFEIASEQENEKE